MKIHQIDNCTSVEIEFEFEDKDLELTQEDYEDIQGCVRDGYNSGELEYTDHSQGLEGSGEIIRGWWKLVQHAKVGAESIIILNRYKICDDGCIYDTEKGEDIPQWIFEFRDFCINNIANNPMGLKGKNGN